MALSNESTVRELVQWFNNRTYKYEDVMDAFNCSRDLIKDRLKEIGLQWDNSAKQMVGEPSADDLNIELGTLFEKRRKRQSKTKPTKVTTNEVTNVRTKERMKESTMIIRKRSSFDIDVELMKELKMQSLIHEKPVYLIVEDAIRKELAAMKN